MKIKKINSMSLMGHGGKQHFTPRTDYMFMF